MWYINIALNDLGKKVVGSDTKVLEFQKATVPNTDECIAYIKSEFMMELVSSFSVTSDWRHVKIGDILKIITPGANGDKIEFGEVTSYEDDGYAKEFHVAIHDIENYHEIRYWMQDIRFSFEGKEIGGSRKYKKYVTMPTKEEIERYNLSKEKSIIYNEVVDLLKHKYEWEEDDDNVIPPFITLDMLINIRNMITGSKKNYEISQGWNNED